MLLVNKCLFQWFFSEKSFVLEDCKTKQLKRLKSVRIMHTVIIPIFLVVSENKLACTLGFIFPASGPTNAATVNDHFILYMIAQLSFFIACISVWYYVAVHCLDLKENNMQAVYHITLWFLVTEENLSNLFE